MSAERERIYLSLTPPERDALDLLVEKGIYLEIQEAIRDALRFFFEMHGIPPFYPEAGD